MHEKPLTDEERSELRERTAAAAVALAPTDWHTLLLRYRAVVDHQEVDLVVDPPSPWPNTPETREEEDGGEEEEEREAQVEPTVVPLPDFPELDALWRLREATYRAGLGAPAVQEATISRQPDSPTGWRLDHWSHDLAVAPAFSTPPPRRAYRRDLRHFPCVRGRRPFWLRARAARVG
ncbi:hypothetical protein [Streptomyces coffeae]|uniref:Uncharacterized protein n=1 Tax=Streptomyces coffeae TaxID=621382 RepID=A0ABS1NLU3_9ACTN|nr:hypothetical protein [Streptomyces coffeae]MBL1101074.1 hypothetical protein [Streptomyces coffeae]